ncbi:MAG TPA: hypothetical protein VKF15_01820 [Nitrososphaerales archaeon]|nr:hypothetical protein [Nitrososphaerales archaeon]
MNRGKPARRPLIRLEELEVKGGEVTFSASIDDSLERYFRNGTLRISYDEPLDGVDPALAAIPFVTTVITVAWATGADVELPVLDRRFLQSIEAVRGVMKSWYPRLPFSSTVRARSIHGTGRETAKREGLLYSGGLDSTASLIRHLDSRPVLILVLGTPDLPAGQTEFHRMFLDQAKPFVERLGLELHSVRGGMLEMIDIESLNEDFGEALRGSWWESIGHGLMLLGACAPLTATDSIGTLRIAASRTADFEEPWGSNPEVDEKLAWGETAVIHDSHHISRQEKIESLIAPFSQRTHMSIPLRVCGSTKSKDRVERRTLNCGRCEKCVRTVVGLLAGGVDPKTCCFDMKDFSAQALRRNLEVGAVRLPKSVWDLWYDIQASVKKRNGTDEFTSMYGARPFFEWMRDYDIERNLYRPSLATRVLGGVVPRLSERRRSAELVRNFKRSTASAE